MGLIPFDETETTLLSEPPRNACDHNQRGAKEWRGTQGNESRLTRLWLRWAENVQQVLWVPGGALAAAFD